jgi:hypothetical protein
LLAEAENIIVVPPLINTDTTTFPFLLPEHDRMLCKFAHITFTNQANFIKDELGEDRLARVYAEVLDRRH